MNKIKKESILKYLVIKKNKVHVVSNKDELLKTRKTRLSHDACILN